MRDFKAPILPRPRRMSDSGRPGDRVLRPLTPAQKIIFAAYFKEIGDERTADQCGVSIGKLRTLVRSGWLSERYPDPMHPGVLTRPEKFCIFRRVR